MSMPKEDDILYQIHLSEFICNVIFGLFISLISSRCIRFAVFSIRFGLHLTHAQTQKSSAPTHNFLQSKGKWMLGMFRNGKLNWDIETLIACCNCTYYSLYEFHPHKLNNAIQHQFKYLTWSSFLHVICINAFSQYITGAQLVEFILLSSQFHLKPRMTSIV